MRVLLVSAAIVFAFLTLAGPAFAQGRCSACETANSRCQSEVDRTAAAYRRACGKSAGCLSAVEKREAAYAKACTTRYDQCQRAYCGGRT